MCQFCSPVKYCVPPVGPPTEPPSPPLGAGHGWQVKKTRVNGKQTSTQYRIDIIRHSVLITFLIQTIISMANSN